MATPLQYSIVGPNGVVAYQNQVGLIGTTAQRPASPTVGQQFWDTTLDQPVWHDGAGWVDADGTTA